MQLNRLCLITSVVLSGICVALAQQPGGVVLSAGYSMPTTKVAPGQIITFFVHGIGQNITALVRADTVPLPTSLAGISGVYVQGSPAFALPLLAVEPVNSCADTDVAECNYMAITVQIPFTLQANSPLAIRGAPIGAAYVRFVDASGGAATANVTPFIDQIHFLRSCDMILTRRDSTCGPIAVTHGNGTLITAQNPATSGEEIVLYAFGLGPVFDDVKAGSPVATPTSTRLDFHVGFDPRPNAAPSRPYDGFPPRLATPAFTGMIPGSVGLYQINVVIPPLTLTNACSTTTTSLAGPGRVNSNLTVNIAGPVSSDGVGICVQ